jgi:alanyl-tRNA synthetase
MSSERLYYTDTYLIEFDAVVRDVEPSGDRWMVTLDRTAFYPTSGGQPFDVGTLAEPDEPAATVLEVTDREDGTIVHLVDRPLEKNARVRGHVDWHRRFDHMQQHTGQHLLSGAFERQVQARTVSFHLGAESSTIDLDKEVTADQLAAVEAAANIVVWEDREISVRFVTAHEAGKLPLRKDPTRTGDLRIVEIENYDLSACGGTHVNRTGAIGTIAIAGAERFKGGTRVEFVCGGRALRAYRALREAVTAGVRLASVLPHELPSAIEKLQAANRSQQKALEALQDRLAKFEAASLAARGRKVGGVTLIADAPAEWDAAGLKKLATAVAADPGRIAILMTAESPAQVVVARSQDVNIDAGEILQHVLAQFGGKGGGRGAVAQGGGVTARLEELVTAVTEMVERKVGP